MSAFKDLTGKTFNDVFMTVGYLKKFSLLKE